MVTSDRPNLHDTKFKALEDLITKYKGMCKVMKSGDYGKTDSTTTSMLERSGSSENPQEGSHSPSRQR